MNDASSKGDWAFCAVCVFFAYVVPWGALVSAAVLSLSTTDPYLSETAAWLVAFGLAWLAISYFWARLVHALQAMKADQQ